MTRGGSVLPALILFIEEYRRVVTPVMLGARLPAARQKALLRQVRGHRGLFRQDGSAKACATISIWPSTVLIRWYMHQERTIQVES